MGCFPGLVAADCGSEFNFFLTLSNIQTVIVHLYGHLQVDICVVSQTQEKNHEIQQMVKLSQQCAEKTLDDTVRKKCVLN